jgi:hexosaminidase
MHKVLFASLLLICCAVARRSSYVRPPRVSDTIDGQPRVKILPQPTNVELGSSPMVGLIPNYKSKFSFNIQHAYTDVEKDMLTKAFKRYNEIIFYDQTIREQGERVCDSKVITCIYAVNVFIKSTASKIDLQLGEDESYSLQTTKNSIDITSPTIWGALHALETVSQMIVLSDPHGSPAYAIQTEMNLPITITDSPRFPWRGLLIDTARHYISKQKIKHIIDSMTYIKLNTFHWHVVDDQSFPIEIPSLPELSNKGRYSPLAVYTPDDIKEIVQYAFERGVRSKLIISY